MSKIVCPYSYEEDVSFDCLEDAFHCYDCVGGCSLVDNVLRPALRVLISRLEFLQKDDDE